MFHITAEYIATARIAGLVAPEVGWTRARILRGRPLPGLFSETELPPIPAPGALPTKRFCRGRSPEDRSGTPENDSSGPRRRSGPSSGTAGATSASSRESIPAALVLASRQGSAAPGQFSRPERTDASREEPVWRATRSDAAGQCRSVGRSQGAREARESGSGETDSAPIAGRRRRRSLASNLFPPLAHAGRPISTGKRRQRPPGPCSRPEGHLAKGPVRRMPGRMITEGDASLPDCGQQKPPGLVARG